MRLDTSYSRSPGLSLEIPYSFLAGVLPGPSSALLVALRLQAKVLSAFLSAQEGGVSSPALTGPALMLAILGRGPPCQQQPQRWVQPLSSSGTADHLEVDMCDKGVLRSEEPCA